jgi:hypothetical protein
MTEELDPIGYEGRSDLLRSIEALAASPASNALQQEPVCSQKRLAATSALFATLQATLPPAVLDTAAGANSRDPAPVLTLRRPQQQRHAAAATAGGEGASSSTTAAAAWHACAAGLATVLRFDEPDVIESVIGFWRGVCGLLDGSRWEALSSRPAVRQQGFVGWLWQAGPELLEAVVGQLHVFYQLTGISHLRQQPSKLSHHSKTLLTLLQLTAAEHAAQQLLQLLGWADSGLTCGDAFSLATQLLQLSADDPHADAWAAAAAAAAPHCTEQHPQPLGVSSGGPQAGALLLAQHAGSFLMSSFHEAAGGRPSWALSDYDACMVRLLAAVLGVEESETVRGDPTGGRAGGARGRSGNNRTGSKTRARHFNDPVCEAVERCGGPGRFGVLARLLASHPQWDVLARGLYLVVDAARRQQQQQAEADATAAPAVGATAAAGGGGKKGAAVAAAVVGQAKSVLPVLAEVARAGAPEDDAPAQAARSAALLLGLSALTRPEAGCGVEWRCEALEGMQRCAARFMEDHPDADDGLHAWLWAPAALDALLSTLLYDPSIKCRRAAVDAAAVVAVPGDTAAAGALVRTLAAKARDKDCQVAVAALELLVQVPAAVMADCFDEQTWQQLVVAGLRASAGGEAATAATQQRRQKRQHELSDDGRAAFLGLLSDVMRWDEAAAARQPGGGRLGGFRRVLLLLLHDPRLESTWEEAARQLEAEAEEQRQQQQQQRRRRQGAGPEGQAGAQVRRRRRNAVVDSSNSDDSWDSASEEEQGGAGEEGEKEEEDDSEVWEEESEGAVGGGVQQEEEGAAGESALGRAAVPIVSGCAGDEGSRRQGDGNPESKQSLVDCLLGGFEEQLAIEMEVDDDEGSGSLFFARAGYT